MIPSVGRLSATLLAWLGVCAATVSAREAGTLTVVGVEPAPRSVAVPRDAVIRIHFDRPINASTVLPAGRLSVFGKWSGVANGPISLSNGDMTVTLSPVEGFAAGEPVMVVLANTVEGADGSPMRPGGYSFQFWTRAASAALQFVEIDRLSTRTLPSQRTQAYGGIASDLNGDGYSDLTIVNEITADLRVMLNSADESGTFEPFLTPTFPVGPRASPSEPADFNGDGKVDLCVANIDGDTVSILLGLGDGTFASQQLVPVLDAPRGIAVLDVDGDGDVDVVNTNSQAGALNMTLLLNDGTGVFAEAPTSPFTAGIAGAWALGAADMNEDGLLDLVVGSQSNQQISVLLSNGDGTFTPAGIQSAGGRVWMLTCGDLNGDGHDDVTTINSTSNNASILLGDGSGGLSAPQTYPADPFGLATDLGDLAGDGDLDWITSSFNGNFIWFLNDGNGVFTLQETFVPTAAASCALVVDVDNDGDLDLALIDESADEVIILQNQGPEAIPAASSAGLTVLTGLIVVLGAALLRRQVSTS